MKKFLQGFDLPGGVWLGMWTLTMLLATVYVTLVGRDLGAGVVSSYAAALTAFAAHSISKVVKGEPNEGHE